MGTPPSRLLDAFLLKLVKRLWVVAQAQTQSKTDGVDHEIRYFVVPGLLHELKGKVEFQKLPSDGEGEENPPVSQEIAADEGPLYEMAQ